MQNEVAEKECPRWWIEELKMTIDDAEEYMENNPEKEFSFIR